MENEVPFISLTMTGQCKPFFSAMFFSPIKTSKLIFPHGAATIRKLVSYTLTTKHDHRNGWQQGIPGGLVPGHGGDGAALFAAPDLLEALDVNSSCAV